MGSNMIAEMPLKKGYVTGSQGMGSRTYSMFEAPFVSGNVHDWVSTLCHMNCAAKG